MHLGFPVKRHLYKKVSRNHRNNAMRISFAEQVDNHAASSSMVHRICDEIERDQEKIAKLEKRNFSHKKDHQVYRERTIRIRANRIRLAELRPGHPLARDVSHPSHKAQATQLQREKE